MFCCLCIEKGEIKKISFCLVHSQKLDKTKIITEQAFAVFARRETVVNTSFRWSLTKVKFMLVPRLRKLLKCAFLWHVAWFWWPFTYGSASLAASSKRNFVYTFHGVFLIFSLSSFQVYLCNPLTNVCRW